MTETIQVALISGLCVAVPTLITTFVNNRNNRTLINYRLDQIEKKQDKYNNVIERTYLLEEKMKVANHRIDDLERKE